jgi:hypothetical protein
MFRGFATISRWIMAERRKTADTVEKHGFERGQFRARIEAVGQLDGF